MSSVRYMTAGQTLPGLARLLLQQLLYRWPQRQRLNACFHESNRAAVTGNKIPEKDYY
jgi:hypothetical protein